MTNRDWLQTQARRYRRHLVNAEAIMWSELRARRLLGYKFRRQHIVGRFILGFYCAEKRLAVEIDGPTHDPDVDCGRDRLLAAAGIAVIRVPNDDVYDNLSDVLDWILSELEARPSYGRFRDRTRVVRQDGEALLSPPL